MKTESSVENSSEKNRKPTNVNAHMNEIGNRINGRSVLSTLRLRFTVLRWLLAAGPVLKAANCSKHNVLDTQLQYQSVTLLNSDIQSQNQFEWVWPNQIMRIERSVLSHQVLPAAPSSYFSCSIVKDGHEQFGDV